MVGRVASCLGGLDQIVVECMAIGLRVVVVVEGNIVDSILVTVNMVVTIGSILVEAIDHIDITIHIRMVDVSSIATTTKDVNSIMA